MILFAYYVYHRVNVVKVLMLIRCFTFRTLVFPAAGDAFSILAAHISREAWSFEGSVRCGCPQLLTELQVIAVITPVAK